MMPAMSQTLLEKVVEEARPLLMPKAQVLEANVRKILDTASGGKLSNNGQAPAPSAAPAAKPAAKK
jgi:hypothetical protein